MDEFLLTIQCNLCMYVYAMFLLIVLLSTLQDMHYYCFGVAT